MKNKRSLSETDIIIDNKKPRYDFDRKELISPSHLRNYILNDPLIDYLEYYKINTINETPNRERTNSIVSNDFEEFIKLKGIDFEKKIMDQFKYKILNIDGIISEETYLKTVNALKNNEPIIYQGVLFDFKNKTYGRPDLIIRGDFLKKIFNEVVKDNVYYIIDIKFSTINISSCEKYITNSNGVAVYKCQILVYMNAINEILNQTNNLAFILGKRYSITKNGNKNTIYNDNYSKVAKINYETNDLKYKLVVKNAINWIFKLRSEGSKWKLLPKPSVNELYPNMSNSKDGKWRPLKKELAEKIKELTLIVNVGYTERVNAFSKNIYSYDDPSCNAYVLGIKGSKVKLVDDLIKINSSSCLDIIRPDKIKFNNTNWRKCLDHQMEFFLDYETTTDFDRDNFIFMIGIGFSQIKWNFKCFITKDKSKESQKEMFNQFWDYINNKLIEMNKKEAIFIHWTDAEPSFYNRAQKEFNLPNKNFLDLYKVFIKEPIVIKGALNYSLKTIANAMYKLKLINTFWDSNSKCSNGLDALVQANKIYYENVEVNNMLEISNYNEIDCKVLCEILEYLRNYH
jgi:predicted RecB family nuclease